MVLNVKKNIDKYKIIYECFLSKFVKTNKKTVFFISFEGQYNDNPKYISEELYRRAADVDIIWCVSKKEMMHHHLMQKQ